MPATKKSNARKPTRKKRIPPVVVVTNTIVPADQTLFPEKLLKAKEILSKTKFLPR
jgi:hypothetical protein